MQPPVKPVGYLKIHTLIGALLGKCKTHFHHMTHTTTPLHTLRTWMRRWVTAHTSVLFSPQSGSQEEHVWRTHLPAGACPRPQLSLLVWLSFPSSRNYNGRGEAHYGPRIIQSPCHKSDRFRKPCSRRALQTVYFLNVQRTSPCPFCILRPPASGFHMTHQLTASCVVVAVWFVL